MPRSTKNSSALGIFRSPSCWRCGGLRTGCRAPRREAPPAVVTMTRWETMFAGSWPPRVWSRTKPLSSTCLTKKPISSMCAATITRAFSEPRFVPMTLPRESVRTSSVRELSSSRAISRCLSSRPGTPGVSMSRLNSASLSATSSPSLRPYAGEPNNGAAARQRRRVLLLGRLLLRRLLLQAPRLGHLGGEVEAQAEVVAQVEDREAQDQGVRPRHLQEDGSVANEPERGERER